MGLERPGTWVVLIVVVVVLFGAKRLPDSAKALGRSLKIFRNGELSNDYAGPRQAAGIVEWVHKAIAAQSQLIADAAALDNSLAV